MSINLGEKTMARTRGRPVVVDEEDSSGSAGSGSTGSGAAVLGGRKG